MILESRDHPPRGEIWPPNRYASTLAITLEQVPSPTSFCCLVAFTGSFNRVVVRCEDNCIRIRIHNESHHHHDRGPLEPACWNYHWSAGHCVVHAKYSSRDIHTTLPAFRSPSEQAVCVLSETAVCGWFSAASVNCIIVISFLPW